MFGKPENCSRRVCYLLEQSIDPKATSTPGEIDAIQKTVLNFCGTCRYNTVPQQGQPQIIETEAKPKSFLAMLRKK